MGISKNAVLRVSKVRHGGQLVRIDLVSAFVVNDQAKALERMLLVISAEHVVPELQRNVKEITLVVGGVQPLPDFIHCWDRYFVFICSFDNYFLFQFPNGLVILVIVCEFFPQSILEIICH